MSAALTLLACAIAIGSTFLTGGCVEAHPQNAESDGAGSCAGEIGAIAAVIIAFFAAWVAT